MSEKPLVFVSHASPDADLAKFIGEQIKLVLGEEHVEVFVSSSDDAIGAGSDWFDEVIIALARAETLVVLITPNSVDRRWVWFEIGYLWRKMGDERRIYPLAVSSSQPIPHPLSTLQVKFLDSEGQIRNFLGILRDQFGFGVVENANIQQLMQVAKNSPIYPHQANLSDDESSEVLREYIKSNYKSWGEKYNHKGEHLFSGKLMRYDELDKELGLPSGSSKKLLLDIANEFGIAPQEHSENTVRLKIEDSGKFHDKFPPGFVFA